MKRWLACALVFLSALFLVAISMVGGVFLDRQVLSRFVPLGNMPQEARAEFRLMAETWNVIQQNYVRSETTEPRQITYGALQGMVSALGDEGHSRFLSPDELRTHLNLVQGELEGIGVEVQFRDGRVVIVAPIDGSPAERAGLRPGDSIVAVDGEQVAGMDLENVIGLVTGPAGTTVTLTIMDGDTGGTRDITLTRARIALENLTWQQVAGTDVALVRLSSFSSGVSQELARTLTTIREQGLAGIVLDLRSNPGGLLSEAVDTTSQFLAEGNALLVRDATGETQPVPVGEGGAGLDMPLVVLVNQGTASAAEIVTGALQDAERATVVGETTFGTGTVLMQFPLSDGSAVLMATEEWLTPAGRVIWKEGLTPDVTVALPDDALPVVPNGDDAITSGELQSSGDAQLRAALELLTDMTAEAGPPTPAQDADPEPEEDADPEPEGLGAPSRVEASAGGAAAGAGEPLPAPAPEVDPAADDRDVVHILLIGGDHEYVPDLNTDSLIVAVLDGRQKRISMLSIPRDLWVQIPGHGGGRINTAHRLGTRYRYPDGAGPGLLARTIEENLGIPIDHWVRINYAGFEAVIDELGGVEVAVACPVNLQYLPPTGPDETEMILEPGIHLLDGETALRYVRTRRGETDFERAERQQQFLRATWEQFKSPGILRRLPGLWSALHGTFATDLSLGDVLRLAPLALDLRHEDVHSLALGREQLQDWTTPGGARVLLPIPEKVAEVVASLYTTPPPAAPAGPPRPPVRVQVRNGTADPDLAALLAAELRWRGMDVVDAGPADRTDLAHSQLLVYHDRPQAVELLTGMLDLRPEDVVRLPEDGQDVDLEIVLGADYDTCH